MWPLMMRSHINLHTFIWLVEVVYAWENEIKWFTCGTVTVSVIVSTNWQTAKLCAVYPTVLLGKTLSPTTSTQGHRAVHSKASSRSMEWLPLCYGHESDQQWCESDNTHTVTRIYTHSDTWPMFTALATGRCIIQPKSLLSRAHNRAVMKDWCVKTV